MSDLRKNYIENGYVIIKNFFSKEKVVETREELIRKRNFNTEILELEHVKNLIMNDGFFRLFKEIFDCKESSIFFR